MMWRACVLVATSSSFAHPGEALPCLTGTFRVGMDGWIQTIWSVRPPKSKMTYVPEDLPAAPQTRNQPFPRGSNPSYRFNEIMLSYVTSHTGPGTYELVVRDPAPIGEAPPQGRWLNTKRSSKPVAQARAGNRN